jgi:hypothetical protein
MAMMLSVFLSCHGGREEKAQFDLSGLLDFKERLLLSSPVHVDRVSPLIKVRHDQGLRRSLSVINDGSVRV